MKRAYVKRTIDYTLKRKGDRIFTVVDENGNFLNYGVWRTRKACREAFVRNPWGVTGYDLHNEMITEHRNYEHWAGFEFAK